MGKSNICQELRNIMLLGASFMLLEGAHFTITGIAEVMLESARNEDPSVTAHGFISLAILESMFAISSFVAPMIVTRLGDRNTLLYGSISYAIFTASFIYPDVRIVYGASALYGFASASVFVANACYITRNSTNESIGKYMGIYWTIMSTGQLFGNLFVYWAFQGSNHIAYDVRFLVLTVLTGICIVSTVTLNFLGPTGRNIQNSSEKSEKVSKADSEGSYLNDKTVWELLLEPFRVLKDKHMLLLIPASIFNGFDLAYFEAIFSTIVGFTESLGDDVRKYSGLAGSLTAVGSIAGGLVFGTFGEKTVKSNRSVIVLIASASFILAAGLIYANHPETSPLGPTMDVSWINPPMISVSLFCSFLLGLGEGCLATQIDCAIGVIWPEDPAAPIAVFRWFQASCCALFLYVGTLTGLSIQLLAFVILCVFGAITFITNEFLMKKKMIAGVCSTA